MKRENNINLVKGLKPDRLWYYFAEICSIPHPSRKEEKIAKYLIDVAKSLKLDYKIDTTGNIVIYKDKQHTVSSKTLILQSHTDMVCDANKDVKINFDTDPIIMRKEGDFIKASGTTLGADNGIGMAIVLALLESKDIAHPKLQCLFTVTEEDGLIGANGLDASLLNGDYLINLDSEDEDKVCIGCAGSESTRMHYKLKRQPIPSETEGLKIVIDGLQGGHSGSDIHKNYGNSIKIVSNILGELLDNKIDFWISHFIAGSKRNAIPRYAEITICLEKQNITNAKKLINDKVSQFIEYYKNDTESGINIDISLNEKIIGNVIDKEQSKEIINLLNCIHTGVYRMSTLVKGLVETSNNLGVIDCDESEIIITTATRSSDMFDLKRTVKQIRTLANMCCESVVKNESLGYYPSWKPLPPEKNNLLRTYIETYEKIVGSKPEIKAIHAGLECGLFSEKMPKTLMISIGPNIYDVHSPNERVNITSTGRFWNILCELLKVL